MPSCRDDFLETEDFFDWLGVGHSSSSAHWRLAAALKIPGPACWDPMGIATCEDFQTACCRSVTFTVTPFVDVALLCKFRRSHQIPSWSCKFQWFHWWPAQYDRSCTGCCGALAKYQCCKSFSRLWHDLVPHQLRDHLSQRNEGGICWHWEGLWSHPMFDMRPWHNAWTDQACCLATVSEHGQWNLLMWHRTTPKIAQESRLTNKKWSILGPCNLFPTCSLSEK